MILFAGGFPDPRWYLPEIKQVGAEWIISEGGFYTWVKINRNIDTLKALDYAVKEYNVAYVAGPSFYPDRSGGEYLRICYSIVMEEDIDEGIKKLSHVFLK